MTLRLFCTATLLVLATEVAAQTATGRVVDEMVVLGLESR